VTDIATSKQDGIGHPKFHQGMVGPAYAREFSDKKDRWHGKWGKSQYNTIRKYGSYYVGIFEAKLWQVTRSNSTDGSQKYR
jgi:hypothetical protein